MPLKPIKIVNTADLPELELVFKDRSSETVVDFTTYTTATFKISIVRKRNVAPVPFDVTGTFVTDGSDGRVTFDISTDFQGLDTGTYEGEVIATLDGDNYPLYETLDFRVREGIDPLP